MSTIYSYPLILKDTPINEKHKKTLFISKIKLEENKNINLLNNKLFKDPCTYLSIPKEIGFNFLVNKELKVSQLNDNENIKPYSLVGTENFRKKKKRESTFNSNSSKSYKKQYTRSNLSKLSKNRDGNTSPRKTYEITDKEIKTIFNRCRELIENNKNIDNSRKHIKEKSSVSFKLNHNSKEDMLLTNTNYTQDKYKTNSNFFKNKKTLDDQFILEPLKLQERTLKTLTKNKNEENEMANFISLKLKNKGKHNKSITNIYDYLGDNCNSEIENKISTPNIINYKKNIFRKRINKRKNAGELLMKTYQNFKKNEKIRDVSGYALNWESSLRTEKNSKDIKKRYLNIKTEKNPLWIMVKEKKHLLKEYIYKAKDPNHLQLEGKNLLNLEEDIIKQLNGKKRILRQNHTIDETKDLIFSKNLFINKHNINS